MNYEKLLNVAKALDESPNPEKFTMKTYAHSCGAPACALGHYAARRDLQSDFYLDENGSVRHAKSGFSAFRIVNVTDDYGNVMDYNYIMLHFGIDLLVEDELFGPDGCNDAKTAKEAAAYIREFVRKHIEEKAENGKR